jgi:hypothetical protein
MQMKNIPQSPRVDSPTTYQIRVLGKLEERWSDWFNGMAITFESGNDGFVITTLTGVVIDQTALHGILNRIRDLNVPLLSVQLVTPETEFGGNNP